MKGVLLDTNVLLDFLQGEASAEVKKILDSNLVSLSVLCFYELDKHFFKIGKTKELEIVRQRLKSFDVKPLTIEICEEATRLSIPFNLSMADAIIYATARHYDLLLVTTDADFKGKKDVIFLAQKATP